MKDKAVKYKKRVCEDCAKYLEFHGEDIKCPKHRKPTNDNGRYPYNVACRKCDNVVMNDSPDDTICGYCI